MDVRSRSVKTVPAHAAADSATRLTLESHDGLALLLRGGAIMLVSVLVGAICAYSALDAAGLALFAGLLWLAFERPATAMVIIVAAMALPFASTPSVHGHIVPPSEIGAVIFIIAGVIRGRWFKLNVIDGAVAAYVTLSVIATIFNEEAWTLVQAHFQSIVLPYVAWRMLFASSSKARDAIVPCLIAVGTVVAIAGFYEFLSGSNSFTHEFINPKLAHWAMTYVRLGHVRLSVSFGQPIALGMFLLIPIGLAVALTGRYYLAALLALVPAEILTLARGAWLGTVVLLLMLLPLILRRTSRSSIVGGVVVLLACGVAFAHPISTVLSSTSQQGSVENASANYRVNLFQTSIERGQLLGNRFNVEESASNLYGDAGFKDPASWYAVTLGEMGWLGLSSLIALAGLTIMALWRGYKYNALMLTAFAAVVLAQMIALITAPPITNYGSFLWLTVALMATLLVNSKGELQLKPKRRRAPTLPSAPPPRLGYDR